MRQLVAAEFLFEQPDSTFVFKHALTQDVAYQRLAPGDRARLHAAAGQAFECLYADRVDEVLHQLTHHWSHTDDHARAIANRRRALTTMETMGKALMVLTLSSLWMGRFAEGLESANRALQLRPASGGASQWRGLTLWVKAHHEILLGRLDAGVRSGEALWDLSARTENGHSQSYGACIPAWVATRRGHIQAALAQCEKALELAPNIFAQAVVTGYFGEALNLADRHAEARDRLSNSVDLCRRMNFPQGIAWNLTRLSTAERDAGDLRAARVHADEALTLARALGLVANVEGDVDAAVDHLSAALAIFAPIDARYDAAIVRLDLATALARIGSREQAALHLTESAHSFGAMAVPVWFERTVTLAHQLGIQAHL